MAVDINLTGVETTTNKQNSLAVDGTNLKYPTVTAVNSGLAGKQNVMGADDNYVTDAQLVVITNTSGTNTGDETTTTIGALINNSTDINNIQDDDKIPMYDAGGTGTAFKHALWSLVKSTLKTYFDTLYKATFSENTAFNKNFGTTSGTVASGLELLNIQQRWITIYSALIQVSANVAANTYALYSNSNLALPAAGSSITSGTAVISQPVICLINSADYPTINGIAPKLRIKAHIATNATAPNCDFAFGLYPLTCPVSAGGAGAKSWTIGTVVTGSNGASQATPSANTHYQLTSSEFSLPTDGVYAICFTNSGTTAAGSYTELQAILQLSN